MCKQQEENITVNTVHKQHDDIYSMQEYTHGLCAWISTVGSDRETCRTQVSSAIRKMFLEKYVSVNSN
jgi:hypothetical protein